MRRKRLTNEELAQSLLVGANRLFDDRVALRQDHDALQNAYEDATGVWNTDLHADPEVKETRDSLHRLDWQIGEVARSMERLARHIQTKARRSR